MAKGVWIRIADVNKQRASGLSWRLIAEKLGIGETSLYRAIKLGKDCKVTRRSRRKGAPSASLAVVNKALSMQESTDASVMACAEEMAPRLRRLGVRRLVIDLERDVVEVTISETFPLAGAA